MDVRLTEESYIFFNAGTPRDSIHIIGPTWIGVVWGLISLCPLGFSSEGEIEVRDIVWSPGPDFYWVLH